MAASVVLLSASPVAAATTWYVATTGNDLNSCTTAATPCMTIQAAINKAAASDIINVAGGAYPELLPIPHVLTINKTLTLLGAMNGVDARGRVGTESSVTDSQGIDVTANDVVIDGFTVADSVNGAFTGSGILIGAKTTGTQILNNIIRDNIEGIGLGGSQALIQHNLIENNNNPGPATGTGIYTDNSVSQGALSNVRIVENAFIGNNTEGIGDYNLDTANGVSNLDISGNRFDQNGRATGLTNTLNSTIHNNRISRNTFAGSAAIRIFDNNSGLSIMHNDLVDGAGMHGIRLSNTFGLGPNSNVVINFNNIGTTPTSFTLSGLTVDTTPAGYNGTVNAICNWWGSSRGPTNASNPSGNGEAVVGPANFTPWWTAPSQTRPCPAPPECKPGEEDNGDGDVQDQNGKHRGHFHFDECDSNQEFSHQDSDNNVDFHSSSGDHSSPQFDANLPVATTTGHGLNNGKDVTYVLVVTAGAAPLSGLYSLTLSDASGVIYVSSGTLSSGHINVIG